jgi:hypothetical protein
MENCLKYVLLLNFDEEPNYDYLIEELKKAYFFVVGESGQKASPCAFRNPVFDWSISLATRLQKILTNNDDKWKQGEANVTYENLSHLNHTLLKSRLSIQLHRGGSGSSNYDSSNAFASPMSSNDFLKQMNHNSREYGLPKIIDNRLLGLMTSEQEAANHRSSGFLQRQNSNLMMKDLTEGRARGPLSNYGHNNGGRNI